MELDVLKSIASLGVGALFGVVVYFMSLREHRTARQQLVDLISSTLEDNKRREQALQDLAKQTSESRDKNTEALTKLAVIIEKLEARIK